MSLRRAIISVSDKTGVADFAKRLVAQGFQIVSTGGTFKELTKAGVEAIYISDLTEHPEVFDGRVKTLHPKVHGGILLNRELPSHVEEAKNNDITPIEMVVVNLYPFEATIAQENVAFSDAIEQIDIGGPTLLRAAAKNHAHVTVVCDPKDYGRVADEIEKEEENSKELRSLLALKAFRHTASYDAVICQYLNRAFKPDLSLPEEIHEPLRGAIPLRYGENPHQKAALYQRVGEKPFGGANVLQGKALSYNNIIDLDATTAIVAEFTGPAVVIVKHTNPCGVGRHKTSLIKAYKRALKADPISAFGGIVALNRPVTLKTAKALYKHFFEVIVAPSFDKKARTLFAKKKNLRLVEVDPASMKAPQILRPTRFGTLLQTPDPKIDEQDEEWIVATKRAPTKDETIALRFLWRVTKHVKSNAIVLGSHRRTFGVGAGQMSRVDAAKLAIEKSTGKLKGASMASDAFFPFADGLEVAAKAGITAVIQPGGSRRDQEVIDAANALNVAMIFTKTRHFKH